MSATIQPGFSGHLLKTCQICFNLKIRCEKTQDSELCDRCLRLGKTCIFNPARRRPRNTGKPRPDKLEVRSKSKRDSKSPSSSRAITPDAPDDIFNADASLDPFERGILSLETGAALLDQFRTRMTPYFPFVVFPKDVSIEELNSQHPCACLAALAAASYADAPTQKALGNLFKQVVGAKMVNGNFNHLDLLRGLLIHLAWAHYMPRPKRYTQLLHLATSIVSDLRLDRPRRPKLWAVEGGRDRNEPDWGPDEMRALAGAYYLSSRQAKNPNLRDFTDHHPSSSVVLQKSRHMSFTAYISRCCEHLGLLNQYPTDKYLAYIIELQKLVEKVEDIVSKTSITDNAFQFFAESQQIAQECAEIKTTLPFPLSDSPPLLLQLHMLELLLSQSSPRGTPFGLDKFQSNPNCIEDQGALVEWLSASMSAARSLISVILILPHGEETAMSNMGWIMTHCGLSLAVRLDLIAAKGSISGSTQHLRRFLDMPHTLRQIVLRLEARAGDATGDDPPFEGLAKRGRRLEEWYLDQVSRQAAASASTDSPQVSEHSGMTMGTEMIPVSDPSPYPNNWVGGPNWTQGPELDMSTFLFADPVDFPGNFGVWN